MIIHNIQQKSAEWFELRSGRVTGTKFKILMMKETTKGYQDMVSEIAAEIITGGKLDEPGFETAIMERGMEMEPFAREHFSETVSHVEEVGFVVPDVGEFHDWIGISPDGLIRNKDEILAGLEIKCPMAKTHLGYLTNNVLPSEYLHQVQGSLFVTGLPVWYFMSYYPRMKPLIIEVTPDEAIHTSYSLRLPDLITRVKNKIEIYNRYGSEG